MLALITILSAASDSSLLLLVWSHKVIVHNGEVLKLWIRLQRNIKYRASLLHQLFVCSKLYCQQSVLCYFRSRMKIFI